MWDLRLIDGMTDMVIHTLTFVVLVEGYMPLSL